MAEPDEADRRHLALLSPCGSDAVPVEAPARPPAAAPCRPPPRRPAPSPRPACRQRGRRSLSISSARTPSTKSCAASTRCTIRYSKRNASSIDRSAAAAELGEGERQGERRLPASSPAASAPKPPGSAASRSHDLRQRRRAEAAIDPPAAARAAALVRRRLELGEALGDGSSCASAASRACDQRRARARASRSDGTACVPTPASRQSAPSSRGPGQAQIHADLARAARQEPGPADVGEEADAGLGHGEQRALGDDAEAAVHRDPDAAAHGDAVEQGDVGLGEGVDAPVQPVLVAEERHRRRDAARRAPARSTATMSPPAQKARPGAGLTSTAPIPRSSRQSASCALRARTMAWVSAFSACCRSRITTPSRPRRSKRMSGRSFGQQPARDDHAA